MADTGAIVVAAKPRKVISSKGRATLNKVPDEILNDPELKLAMDVLPDNYNLEIPKAGIGDVSDVDTEIAFTDDMENKERQV